MEVVEKLYLIKETNRIQDIEKKRRVQVFHFHLSLKPYFHLVCLVKNGGDAGGSGDGDGDAVAVDTTPSKKPMPEVAAL